MTPYIDLNQFIDPWGMPPKDEAIHMAPLCLATNGHIGIAAYEECVVTEIDALREAETDDGSVPWESHAAMLAGILDVSHAEAQQPWGRLPAFEVPAKDAACLECAGSGSLGKCGKCQGDGIIECPCCGSETDCKTCVGSGYMPAAEDAGETCGRCGGVGRVYSTTERERAVAVEGVHFDTHYLALIKDFPGLKVAVSLANHGNALAFRWDHGVGLVMEVRIFDGKRDSNGNAEKTA